MRIVISSAAAVLCCLAGSTVFAKTVAVGICEPSLVSFTTIQAAVDHSPAGATVDICPGTYPEQVSITKSLTLTGLAYGNTDAPTIVFPASGAVANANDLDGGGQTAAQILVVGPASVTINNLTINGAANNDTSCGLDIVGILYQNASGTVHGNNVLNETQLAGYTGCQNGLAIYVETSTGNTSTVKITSNIVTGYQKNGITADDAGTNATITGNVVLGAGPTGGAAENAVQVAYGATATISGNRVGDDIWAPDTSSDTGDAAAGILVYDSANVVITSNIVDSNQYGIAVVSDGNGSASGATITQNSIYNTEIFDAVDICGAGNATISGNTIWGATESAIHLDSSCGVASTGNTVSTNHVNGTCAGVLEGASSGGSVTAPITLNTVNIVLQGSDQCPASTVSAITKRHAAIGRHVSPLR
jgi:parallel beta-helix repeat protein